MALDNLSAQRKTDAAPGHVLAMQALEGCEYPLEVFARDADPVIGDGEPVLAVGRFGGDLVYAAGHLRCS